MSRRRRKQPSRRPPAPPPPRLKVRQPSDFVAVVPYLLGFHPTESLVCLFLAQGQVKLTMRVDLPPGTAVDQAAGHIRAIADHHQAGELLLIGYGEDILGTQRLLTALADRLDPAGILDVLHVGAGRWWSLICDGPCCPLEGTPYEAGTHPLAAEAVYAGLTVSPSRADLRASVDGPPATEVEELEQVVDTQTEVLRLPLEARRAEMAQRVRDFVAAPLRLGDADCVRLALLATDKVVRDVAWASMSRAEAAQHVELWRQVVARTVSPLAPAPLCLLGMAGWIVGNGTLLNCCIERMEDLDPGYSMLQILSDISSRAVPPSIWDDLVASMRSEVGLLAG